MKIFYIHQYFSTPSGAAGTRSYEFAKALQLKGHQVTMVCGSSSMTKTGLSTPVVKGIRRGIVDGIYVIEIVIPYSNYDGLFKRAFKFLQFAWRSIKIVFKGQFDVLFATSTPLTVALPGILLKYLKPKKKFVFEVRDAWPELPKALGSIKNPVVSALLTWLERRAYVAADALIGLSPGIVSHIEKIVPQKPVMMIPNGCDTSFFQASSEPVELANIKETDYVAIFTGAHGMANGLDAVLNAAKVLKLAGKKAEHIKFLFVGDGKLKPHLCRRAEKEALVNCIFLPPMPKENLRYLLKRANVGLMILANVPAFYYGTSPNKFFDYIAAGLPVLNNYPGWLAGLIETHQCGVVVSPDNPEQFSDALLVLSKQERAVEMKTKTQSLAAEFDRNKLATQFVLYLEKIYKGNVSREPEILPGTECN